MTLLLHAVYHFVATTDVYRSPPMPLPMATELSPGAPRYARVDDRPPQ